MLRGQWTVFVEMVLWYMSKKRNSLKAMEGEIAIALQSWTEKSILENDHRSLVMQHVSS